MTCTLKLFLTIIFEVWKLKKKFEIFYLYYFSEFFFNAYYWKIEEKCEILYSETFFMLCIFMEI